jgi:hypothetical protein
VIHKLDETSRSGNWASGVDHLFAGLELNLEGWYLAADESG